MSTLISIGGAVRGRRGRPAPVVSAHRSAMRVVERTTTTIREIYVDDDSPSDAGFSAHPYPAAEAVDKDLTSPHVGQAPDARDPGAEAVAEIRGLDRVVVRLGLWLVRLGRNRAVRPGASAEDIAERMEATKSHNARFGFGATTYLG
ncbi:hypothetical protein KACC15558_07410 [Brevibacterium ammoniilyticum]|uniref:Uncharacterized protein n=1 Tax=Brevibacterium ammoniilyticum TaxID=1046555 RepID=A0ABP9TYK2_9MICO